MLRCLLVFCSLLVAAPAFADPPKPKLVVVVFFDQMRGDYVAKWQPLFGEGGFKRLQTEGAWFADCHYPYAVTTTGPGHASVLAGCGGEKHGIINNNWFDRAAAKTVYCAASDRYSIVSGGTSKKGEAGNPDKFLTQTLADVLKESTDGRGKVFGLSLKDRSALFPVGKRPDGAYWFTGGRFGTSTYYRDRVHPWVEAFNKSGKAESYFGKDWNRFRTDLDYAKHSGPDNATWEGKGTGQGVTFPHAMTGGQDKLGSKYYSALANSPYGSELLLALAKTCIVEEKLGQDDVPDLLTVSFSSNDLIGHTWGPDSQEVLDITLRSDALMAELLSFLDAKVGKGNYALLMTADHGVCPCPEVSAAKGIDAKRVSLTKLLVGAEKVLQDAYGKPTDKGKKDRRVWIEAVAAPHIYLNYRMLKASKIDPDEAAAKLADWLSKQPDIDRAYTRKQLLGELPAADKFAAMMRRSYYPGRGGDVMVILKPYYLPGSYGTGSTHGTPHPYDTHVPLLAYGPGVAGGRRDEKVTPLHASAIAAKFLGVAPPKDHQYEVPATLAKP
jgi:hypothetical protein